jgi:oligoendopeptidase F
MFAKAKTDAVRIQMLDQQLMSGVTFLMSLPIRFEYERALYLLAEQGPFTANKLTDTWTRLWKQGYGGRLSEPSTHGWCSTLHYYISHFGYYNWPYTFGYLFSGYVYQRAQQEGEAFRESFRNLLIGTGYMDSVPLVKETLGADLRDPGFWINAIQPLLDIEKRFSAMTDPLVAENISEA